MQAVFSISPPAPLSHFAAWAIAVCGLGEPAETPALLAKGVPKKGGKAWKKWQRAYSVIRKIASGGMAEVCVIDRGSGIEIVECRAGQALAVGGVHGPQVRLPIGTNFWSSGPV